MVYRICLHQFVAPQLLFKQHSGKEVHRMKLKEKNKQEMGKTPFYLYFVYFWLQYGLDIILAWILFGEEPQGHHITLKPKPMSLAQLC